MMGEAATADAVARARQLPQLRVGLHVVTVSGQPVLPPKRLPDLVGSNGRFSDDPLRAGLSYFFRPRAREQLAAEIRAQFEAFRASGLDLEHVDAHAHMQLHPSVLSLILEIGRDFGLPALRVPYEPGGGFWSRLLLGRWTKRMRRRLAAAGVKANDNVFGFHDTGRMTETRVRQILAELPDGVSEIYFHPATGPWPDMPAGTKAYRLEEEFAALISPAVAEAVRATEAQRVGYGDL